MRIKAKLLLIFLSPLLAACLSALAGEYAPPATAAAEVQEVDTENPDGKPKAIPPPGGNGQATGGQAKTGAPAHKEEFTFVPVPFVATTPNEGVSYGALAAIMKYNKQNEVATLIAPQYNYNHNFGDTGTLYGAFYPKPNQQLEVNISKSTIINQDYDVRFRDKTFLDSKLETNGYAGFFADGSARFFGFQSDSHRRNQTNYTDQETGLNLSVGYEVLKNFQVAFGERFRDVYINHGALKDLPYIGNLFTQNQVPGINGFRINAQRVAFIYNSMDSRITPTEGLYGRTSVESANALFGSSDSFQHYEAEVKGYFPLDNARFVTVTRFAYSQTLGNNVPFLEQASLGGENTLRGYGRNRFIANSYLLGNLEERIRIGRIDIFDVNAEIEAAPFFDSGTVVNSITNIRHKNFQFNPGIGFRGIIRPNIVGRVDMGAGSEGIAIFAGLGYPF
jgi:hypothetical protein